MIIFFKVCQGRPIFAKEERIRSNDESLTPNQRFYFDRVYKYRSVAPPRS